MFSVVLVNHRAATTPNRARALQPNGQRLQQRFEFDDQDHIDQDEGKSQHDRQIAKRFLLLLIQPAVFDGGAGRQLEFFGEFGFDRGDAVAQVDAFEASGNRRELPQVFAVHFQNARLMMRFAPGP